MTNPDPDVSARDAAADEERRGVLEFVREAWSQALSGVSAGEEEVQRIVTRLGDWLEGGPDEARRVGNDLTERLREQRDELEETLNAAVRRAVAPFRLPTPDEVQALTARLDRLEERVRRLAEQRR